MTGPDREVVDAPARLRIGTELGRRLAVDAGAGSGKTTSLIDRIVSLVTEGGVPMGSIAAITFTEAAAAELRLRLRRALVLRAQDDPRCAAPARDVDDAAISTIHAFALRILSEHWLDAGLPPRVEVLDSAGSYLDHTLRWRQFVAGLDGDPQGAAVLGLAFADGLRLGQLSELARLLADHYDRLTDTVMATLSQERDRHPHSSVDLGPLIGQLQQALAAASDCTDPADRLSEHLQTTVANAIGQLTRLVGSTDEAEVLAVLRSLGKLSSTSGNKENWPDVSAVRHACQTAERGRADLLASIRESVVADLGLRLARFVLDAAEARRDDGRLTYHDLLVEAQRLLATNPEVLASARSRYQCILIDEFQDTDPLQTEIARLLSEPSAKAEFPARLFIVGDPAQSIYRFRRAEVTLFQAMVGQMDDRIELSANFRSVPEILGFVEAVFDGLAEVEAPVVRRRLDPARPARPAHGPVVATLGGAHDDNRARDVRLVAGGEVAGIVRSIVEDGWEVEDEHGQRAARYADVAVLMPTRTSLPVLERAFEEAAVPYRLEGATLVWGSQDVVDLRNILRAVEDPGDPLAVVAALRTPALACGDDDLVRFHETHRSWDPRVHALESPEGDDPVASGMRVLARLHERRMWLEPSAMVMRVLTELHLFELALVHRRPRDHWQRLRWVLDQSRAFDEASGGTLGDFLHWVELNEEADRWSTSFGPPDPDDDTVRVMTVHGAKGLEFPIVVLTGLDAQPSAVPPGVLFEDDGTPRFRLLGDLRSAVFHDLATREIDLDYAERLRLLYVALTRARDHLLIDLNHKAPATPIAARLPLAAIVSPHCIGRAEALAPPEPPETPASPARASAGGNGGSAWWEEQDRFAQRREAMVRASARQPAWSATALSAAAAGLSPPPRRAAPGQGRGAPPAATDAEVQRHIGRAVHDALARTSLPPDGTMSSEAAEVARGAARAQHLGEAVADRVVALVASAMASPLVRSLAAGRHWKELPLAAPIGSVGQGADHAVLEGFADLVGESEEGLTVVDFKTAAGQSPALQYLEQVAAYAYALRQATGRPVVRVAVCYLHEDGTDEERLEGAALESAIETVLAAARPAADELRSADAADAGQLALFDTP